MSKKSPAKTTRRWTIHGLLAASVIGLGIVSVVVQIDQRNPLEAAQAAERPAQKIAHINPWVYARTQAIRRELLLRNDDLASIGLGLNESKAVLTTLRTWVEQNRKQIEDKDRAIYLARRELQVALRSVRVGPRNEKVIRSLPGLEKALSDAKLSLLQFQKQAGESIERHFTNDQLAAWRAAKVNLDAGVPLRYRFVRNLSKTQRDRIVAALSKRNAGLSHNRFADADRELSAFQLRAVVQARANRASKMEMILQAEKEALPQESEQERKMPAGADQ